MIAELRSLLGRISPSLDLGSDTNVRKLFDNLNILFYGKGMLKSIITGRPLDNDENYLPWYTYSVIDYLNQLDFSECEVIEFGSGYSTLFWSNKAKNVQSIERDESWFSEISQKINCDNVDIHLITEDDMYFQHINTLNKKKYDVVIIDGKDRYETMVAMHQTLKKGGVLIFDNSDWYPGSCSFLREHGYTQVDFTGFGPINNYTWCTSIFFNSSVNIPHKPQLDFIGRREVIKEDDI